jgi:hypothetical protein
MSVAPWPTPRLSSVPAACQLCMRPAQMARPQRTLPPRPLAATAGAAASRAKKAGTRVAGGTCRGKARAALGI